VKLPFCFFPFFYVTLEDIFIAFSLPVVISVVSLGKHYYSSLAFLLLLLASIDSSFSSYFGFYKQFETHIAKLPGNSSSDLVARQRNPF